MSNTDLTSEEIAILLAAGKTSTGGGRGGTPYVIHKSEPLGVKHDTDKLEWSLLPMREIEEVIKVLMHGAKEYSPDNWQYVKPKKRYYDGLMRHMSAWKQGHVLDDGPKGSGLPHVAHAICNLLFLLWHDTEDDK